MYVYVCVCVYMYVCENVCVSVCVCVCASVCVDYYKNLRFMFSSRGGEGSESTISSGQIDAVLKRSNSNSTNKTHFFGLKILPHLLIHKINMGKTRSLHIIDFPEVNSKINFTAKNSTLIFFLLATVLLATRAQSSKY